MIGGGTWEGAHARHEATDGEGNEKKAACGSCISPIKTAKQPWLSAKAAMPRSKARAGCGSTFAQFTTSPAPTAHELNLKIFWSGARSRRGTWARGKPLLRPDRDYAQHGVGPGSVSAGGFAIIHEEDDARLPGLARQVLQMPATQIEQIEAAIMALEKHHQTNPLAFLVLIVHGAFWPSQVVNQNQPTN